jgi:hypothetical protein
MMLLRMLNWQGIAGIAASLCLAVLLALQKGETRHWRKQSGQFEQLYRAEQSAFATTVASYRAAAETARAADRAAAERVAAAQRAINERTIHDFEARLAVARASADRLRREAGAATDPGSGGSPPVPGLSASPGQSPQAAGNGFSLADRLVATEQAIQLDELINWVRRQAAVDPNSDPRSR